MIMSLHCSEFMVGNAGRIAKRGRECVISKWYRLAIVLVVLTRFMADLRMLFLRCDNDRF
jgi:hypothetical protein